MPKTLPPVPFTVRYLTNSQSERVNRLYPPRRGSRCITCQGERSFLWYGEARDPESLTEYECPCDDQYRLHRRFLHSGIPESYQRKGWDDFIEDPAEDVLAWVVDYLEHTDRHIARGSSAIIWGTRGTGKTLLSNLLVKSLVVEGVDVYSGLFQTLIDLMASGWKDRGDAEWFQQKVRNTEVLVIDDVGKEQNRGAGTLGEHMLEDVLRHRIARSLPSIITTNESPDDMLRGYGAGTVSLLSESALELRMPGKDWRSEINSRAQWETVNNVTRPVMVG